MEPSVSTGVLKELRELKKTVLDLKAHIASLEVPLPTGNLPILEKTKCQRTGKKTLFRLWSCDRKTRKCVLVGSFSELVKRGREKFNLACDIPVTIVLEQDGTEIDEDEVLQEFPGATLILLKPGESWTNNSMLTPAGNTRIPNICVSSATRGQNTMKGLGHYTSNSTDFVDDRVPSPDAVTSSSHASNYDAAPEIIDDTDSSPSQCIGGTHIRSLSQTQSLLLPTFPDDIEKALKSGHIGRDLWGQMLLEATRYYGQVFPNLKGVHAMKVLRKQMAKAYPNVALHIWLKYTTLLGQRLRTLRYGARCGNKKYRQRRTHKPTVAPPRTIPATTQQNKVTDRVQETVNFVVIKYEDEDNIVPPETSTPEDTDQGDLGKPLGLGSQENSDSQLKDPPAATQEHDAAQGSSRWTDAMNLPTRDSKISALLDIPTPQFSELVHSRLMSGDEKDIWSELIIEAGHHYMEKAPWLNRHEEYNIIGCKMCETYPCLKRTVGRYHWSVFTDRLSKQMRHLRFLKRIQEGKHTCVGPKHLQSSRGPIGKPTKCKPGAARPTVDTPLPKFSKYVAKCLKEGQSEPVWKEMVTEAAAYYYEKFPDLRQKGEYKMIGMKMFAEYPCIGREGRYKWSAFNNDMSRILRGWRGIDARRSKRKR